MMHVWVCRHWEPPTVSLLVMCVWCMSGPTGMTHLRPQINAAQDSLHSILQNTLRPPIHQHIRTSANGGP